MGNSTISMAIFKSYFDITRGYPMVEIDVETTGVKNEWFPQENDRQLVAFPHQRAVTLQDVYMEAS